MLDGKDGAVTTPASKTGSSARTPALLLHNCMAALGARQNACKHMPEHQTALRITAALLTAGLTSSTSKKDTIRACAKRDTLGVTSM